MKFVSTRGQAPSLDFEEVTLAGLATDGGLYVPEEWPRFSDSEIRSCRGKSYRELAKTVLGKFTSECLTDSELSALVDRAYSSFNHSAIAPLKQLDSSLYVMELFHGPTLAFKDFALQFLGQLFEHILGARGRRCTIVGATSGDTGSAAIEAVRGLSSIELFMLHPHGRVSDVQRKQMTTVTDDNIHNLAVDGTFDDCQNLVKAMFNDQSFRQQHQLSAVNSINWARIAAQVVYYFRAALELGSPDRAVNFAVPTGNFGNVFAGYVARQMGLPINRLIIGSNSNDILTRFFETGHMEQKGVNPTLSPSMDIQISSNFERYLFELSGRDSEKISRFMRQFSEQGTFSVSDSCLQRATELFFAHRLDDGATRDEVRRVYTETGEVMDPHSVIGVAAARVHAEADVPTVVLGTAHPAKFGTAVEDAIGIAPVLPDHLGNLMDRPETSTRVSNSLSSVQQLINQSS
ncbi:MAG: threonine synthase [Pseudomonadota bacterium]